ncbi:TPA: DUF4935 domain-containing protein [Morganella morganii]|nr:DUF4935 domain-containing protein [Morganella morganii]HDF2422449.1 DUF4935 domain-containing protein [Morganella morganii]
MLKIKNIVLDSNFLIRDFKLSSKDTVQLIKLKDYHKINLLIPSVVYDECIENYSREIDKIRSEILSSLKNYNRKVVDVVKAKIDEGKITEIIGEGENYYIPVINTFIGNNNIEKIPYPNIGHREIVMRMYERKLPFKKKEMEVGYKDLLIITSIKEHVNKDEVTVFLSANVTDFCEIEVNNNESNKLQPISDSFDAKNIYLVKDIGTLANLLSEQLNLQKTQTPWSNDEIEEFIKSQLSLSLCSSGLYGGFAFSIEDNKNIIVSISDVCTKRSDDNYVEVTGKTKIQMDCHFEVNSFNFPLINDEFIFYKKVIAAMKTLNYSEDMDDYWEIKFSNYNFCREFNFSITDFDYKKGQPIDDAFLDITFD